MISSYVVGTRQRVARNGFAQSLLAELFYNLENIQQLLKLVYTFLHSVYGITNRLSGLTNLYLG